MDQSKQPTIIRGTEQTDDEPTDSYAHIGSVYEKTIVDANGNIYTRTRNNYIDNALGNDAYSILTSSALTQQYDGSNSSTDTATTYDYDSYGNPLSVIRHGLVNGNINGTFTDIGSDTRTVESTFTGDLVNYIVGKPTEEVLRNNAGDRESETVYTYDPQGNMTSQSGWIDGNNYATTGITYNSFGLPTIQTDALGNTTATVYDTHNMYPQTVTNALSHTTTTSYDYSSGKPTQVTDANGAITIYDYDGLDRLVEVQGVIGNGSAQTLRTIDYNTTASLQYTKETRFDTGSDTQDTYTYIDGFGKTIQTKAEMDSGWATLDTVYNEMGRTEMQSLPYETATSGYTGAGASSDLYTTFIYDTLGRVTQTETVKGATQTEYNGFETTITDALNNTKELLTDAFGNLISVVEYNGNNTYTTDYKYDTRNLLTRIDDAENNTRDLAYDGLGRRTMLEDLHHVTDTQFGVWDYGYDDINLVQHSSPNGNTTYYTYDVLNRAVTENNTSTSVADVTSSYDSCTNGIGRLCTVATPNNSSAFTYLLQGPVDTETKNIAGNSYVFGYDYNRSGNVTQITQPNGSAISYGYNTRGLADTTSYNGGQIASVTYGIHGRPVSVIQNNGTATTLSYNQSELYELINKKTTSNNSGQILQDLSYEYDDVGNILGINDVSDTSTAKFQKFVYDDLYRLTDTVVTNAANGQNYSRSYAYSPIGNITNFDGIGYGYIDAGYSNPHAVTDIGGQNYSYDNNGNLISDGLRGHNWDYRNRLTASNNGSSISTYQYDTQNQRTLLTEGSDITVYPSTNYEVKNGEVKTSINLGDIFVASNDNGVLNYAHTDHLGGTAITTDQNGIITQTLDYYPFGDTRIDAGTDNEAKQYTGYTKDADTGLSYAGARYYSGNIGRFISQDPVALFDPGAFLSDPQQLNSYTYARNNPVIFVDPNGESALLASGLMITSMLISPGTANAPSESSYTMYASPIGPQQPKTSFNTNINFAPSADPSVVSSYSIGILKSVMEESNNNSLTITSTARTPAGQARIMHGNITNKGIQSQYNLYGSYGDQVIDQYPDQNAMLDTILEIGPSNVSRHLADPLERNTFDVAPSSVQYKQAFERSASANDFINKFLTPGNGDPAYHIEINQKKNEKKTNEN